MNNSYANFEGNLLRYADFQAKKLKCQSENQTTLARKLTRGD